MNNLFPTLRLAPRFARLLSWPGILLMFVLPGSATAHDLFASYIQHKIRLSVDADHVDVVVDLTFFEEWAGRERSKLDADANGRITRSELESYARELAPRLSRQVRLRIDGRELDLIPLYDPELDLLGSPRVGLDHHRLRLSLFAATPATLHAGAELTIEDSLWPEAKALGSIEAEGSDGFALKAIHPSDPAFPPARPDHGRIFKVRCLKAPVAKPK